MGKWLVLVLIFGAAGCSSTLEDGYKPHLLGASDAERRSFYAPPFTPEAHAADTERDQEINARRPRPGY